MEFISIYKIPNRCYHLSGKVPVHQNFSAGRSELVKSLVSGFFVIPAKAGIQKLQELTSSLGSGFHRSDG
jgi:hypothetical protein